jgi:hypothetical protein
LETKNPNQKVKKTIKILNNLENSKRKKEKDNKT